MSEQFAIQPEEFDSTNQRLDSILDRLNSLGQSASEMSAAPLRPLQSVPPLGDDALAESESVEDSELVPPVIPQLGLVPPAIPTDDEVDQDEIGDTSNTAFASLETVDAGADFESVTTLVADHDLDDHVEVAPQVLEAPETGWVTTGNEASEVDVATPVTDEDIAVAEAVDSEAIAAELDEVVEYEAEVVPEVPVLEAVSADETKVFDTEITAPKSIFDQVAPESQVFESDAPAEHAPVEPQRPEAPTSIFSSSLTRKDAPEVESPVAETDGWISHSSTADAPAENIAPAVTTSAIFDQDEATFAEPVVAEPVVAEQVVAEPEVAQPAVFQDVAEPDFFQSEPMAQSEPVMIADEVEQTLGDFDQLEGADSYFSAAPDLSVLGEGIDAPVLEHAQSSFDALDAQVAESATLYDSDEDLPLPDFTGVYDETPETTEAAVKTSPKVARASARDKELDKLRPKGHDSELPEAAVQAEERQGWTPLLQLIFVIGFGVAVLVFFWVQDPSAVQDMRNELDAILGRN